MLRRTAIRRKTPMKKGTASLKRVPIRKKSRRRIQDEKIYFPKNREFLDRPENWWCPVAEAGLLSSQPYPHRRRSTEVHHAWRRGKHYLDESTWIGMSSEGNQWVEANKEEARARGWLCDTAETRARWLAKKS